MESCDNENCTASAPEILSVDENASFFTSHAKITYRFQHQTSFKVVPIV